MTDVERLLRASGSRGKASAPIPTTPRRSPSAGTTLVEQIIASHPGVHAGGELSLLDEITTNELRAKGALSRAIPERYDHAIAMPHAAIIHVRRDPLDTCVSCFTWKRFADDDAPRQHPDPICAMPSRSPTIASGARSAATW